MNRRGFILVEISVAYVLLTVGLVALLPVFVMAIKASKSTEKLQVSTYLSQELLEEIRLRKWDQSSAATASYVATPTVIGIDAGETATNKLTFNDIDDFNGWTESPPRDPLNNTIPSFSGYTRSVTVAYANSSLVVLSTPTTSDYKLVSVCTRTAATNSICLTSLFTNR